MAVLHETELHPSASCLESWNLAEKLGVADAAVLADTTLALLQADITGLAGHETETRHKQRLANDLKHAYDLATLTPTNIAAADTVAGIRTLLAAACPLWLPTTTYGDLLTGA
jgi:hypothetical protein